MNRIRVLAMISSMRGGGSEQQTLLLLRHLDRARFEPHLFLLEKEGPLLDRVPDDVTLHTVDPPVSSRFYIPGRIFRHQAEQLREHCDHHSIDVIYDRTFRMTLLAAAAADSLGVPRVSTIVSPPERAVPLVEKRLVAIKRNRLASAYRRSGHVIAVSDQAKQSAMRYYRLDATRVETIANPVDREALWQSVHQSASPIPNRSDARRELVVVGRMSVEKGHADLVEAMKSLDQRWPLDQAPLRIRMIGDGPLRSDLISAADRLNRHQIEFVGPVANPARDIAAAEALILPSHFEGMPNVVLEAMALGTDVIATRSGGTIELERDEPTIRWAEPRDPQSLAVAIEGWAKDPARAESRRAAAARMIDTHHDVVQTTRRIENRLISAVNGP